MTRRSAVALLSALLLGVMAVVPGNLPVAPARAQDSPTPPKVADRALLQAAAEGNAELARFAL